MSLCHVFFLLLCLNTLQCSLIPQEAKFMTALKQLLHAIDRLTSFFAENVNEVNLDAIYGLRVTEGALRASLAKHSSFLRRTNTSTSVLYQQFEQLRSRAGFINEQAQDSIKEQSNDYYYTFKDIVDKPWSFFTDFGQRKLPKAAMVEIINKEHSSNSSWDEDQSDRCMSEALGSNPNHIECMFSSDCIDSITDHRQVRYGPTHQILFLTLALMHGCQAKYSKILKERLGMDVDELIEDRCSQIMREMLGIEKSGITEDNRDLYMEQGFVCALHGYGEFLTLKRLKNILSWQREVGCFGQDKHHDKRGYMGTSNDEEGRMGTSNDNEEYMGTPNDGLMGIPNDKEGYMGTSDDNKEMSTLMDKLGHRDRRKVGSFRSMRRLLVDVTVAHGCSAHESGVAAGLLGLYTKWLLSKLDKNLIMPPVTPSIQSEIAKHTKQASLSATHRPSTKDKASEKTSSTNNMKNRRDNQDSISAKEIYIRTMIISFVTTLLTIAVVFSLYKIASSVCCRHVSKKGSYRRLIDA